MIVSHPIMETRMSRSSTGKVIPSIFLAAVCLYLYNIYRQPTESMSKLRTMASSLPTILIDGRAVPQLGFGTGTRWSKRGDPNINRPLVETIKKAISLGFTHLDCADDYNTEVEVGLAIKESGLPREAIYVTTKVRHGVYDIPRALNDSLSKLQLEYVDLYLIHAPWAFEKPEDISVAWSVMESLRAKGLAKSIGVSNFRPVDMKQLFSGKLVVTPAVNQIEYHPYRQRPEVMGLMREHGVAAVGFGALVPLRKRPDGPVDGYVKELAEKYGVGDAEVLMRWQMDKGLGVITTSSNEEHMREFLKVSTFKLTDEEVAEMNRLGAKLHFKGYWPEEKDTDEE